MSWPQPKGHRRNWLGPVRTASGGMRRHKVQAIAIGLVVLVSTASATLGLALLAASNAPFTHAFATQNGAHLTVTEPSEFVYKQLYISGVVGLFGAPRPRAASADDRAEPLAFDP